MGFSHKPILYRTVIPSFVSQWEMLDSQKKNNLRMLGDLTVSGALSSKDYIRTDRTAANTDTWLKLDFARGVFVYRADSNSTRLKLSRSFDLKPGCFIQEINLNSIFQQTAFIVTLDVTFSLGKR